jgi:hypothetical protein
VLEAVKIARDRQATRRRRCAWRDRRQGLRRRLAKDVAYWGPEIKKLGISGE